MVRDQAQPSGAANLIGGALLPTAASAPPHVLSVTTVDGSAPAGDAGKVK